MDWLPFLEDIRAKFKNLTLQFAVGATVTQLQGELAELKYLEILYHSEIGYV